jgi:uncharacterized cupredoxin-like copper-binding protein
MSYYRFALAVFFVALLGLGVACGSSTTSSSSQPGQTPAPISSSQPTQVSPAGMHMVYVTLFDDRIESSMMSFVQGTPYHFVVTDQGHSPYTFAMMSQDREQEMEHMTLDERHHAALFMDDSIMPGQSKTFDYTFRQSMMGMGQHLEFACYQQGQNQVHMRLPFTAAQD